MLTVGQLLLNDALPPDIERPPVLDKAGISKLYRDLAQKYPDKYTSITKTLSDIAVDAARRDVVGGFSLADLALPKAAAAAKRRITERLKNVVSASLPEPERSRRITDILTEEAAALEDETFTELAAKQNPLAMGVVAGARGNKSQLKRVVAGDTVYMDAKGEFIPYYVQNSYAAGVKPSEFWAASYGARKGLVDMKLGVADSGYVSKLLSRAAHRLVVVAKDSLLKPKVPIGLPVSIDDNDSVGALLAIDTGPYPANTIITPKVLDDLRSRKFKNILVRSPISSTAPSGIYAADVGVRATGDLPSLGSMPGLEAAQAVGERLAQTTLSAKAVGGVQDKLSGFAAIEKLINVPKVYGGATHAQVSGRVNKVYTTDIGEHVVVIGDHHHKVAPQNRPLVKVGDVVEAGDILSDGLPNPAEVVTYKGIGEGRRAFVQYFVDAMRRAGLPVHRRNVELLARGLIDHVAVTENFGDYMQGDIVPYSAVAAEWSPRKDSRTMPINSAIGYYLEMPVLHYTIGTVVTPRVAAQLKEFGVDKIQVHQEPPPWQPQMIRAAATLEYDPNWLTRLLGSNQIRVLLAAARRGAEAPLFDTSYVAAKAVGMPLEQWSARVVRK